MKVTKDTLGKEKTPSERPQEASVIQTPTFQRRALPMGDASGTARLPLPIFSATHLPTCGEETLFLVASPVFKKATPLSKEKEPELRLLHAQRDALGFLPTPMLTANEVELALLTPPKLQAEEHLIAEEVLTQALQAPHFSEDIPPPPKGLKEDYKDISKILSQQNPIVEGLDRFYKFKSFQEIIEEAVKYGSIGDIRALNKHSILKTKYLKQVLQQLFKEATFLLPKSSSFDYTLCNNQEQIDLFASFCEHLIQVEQIDELKLNPNAIISHLFGFNLETAVRDAKLTQSLEPESLCSGVGHFQRVLDHLTANDSGSRDCVKLASRAAVSRFKAPPFLAMYEEKLLEFKDFIYSYLSTILEQEKRENLTYGNEIKKLSVFEESLSALAKHIVAKESAIEARVFHSVKGLNLHLWQDLVPLPFTLERPECTQEDVNLEKLQESLTALQKGGAKAHQLKTCTNQILSLPESNALDCCTKAQYILNLSETYFKLFTLTALKRGVLWMEVAMGILKGKIKDDDPLVLKCYEARGASFQKMGKLLEEKGTAEKALALKKIDEASRDFRLSFPLAKEACPTNFVRHYKQGRRAATLDEALEKFDEAIHGDPFYAESHYYKLLNRLENGHLTEGRFLHSTFKSLLQISALRLIPTLREIFSNKIYNQKKALFQVVLSSRSALFSFDGDKLFISKSNPSFLNEMLTKGAKKIQEIDPSKRGSYCTYPVSEEMLYTLVLTFQDQNKRIGEIEQALTLFKRFEIASLYKSSIADVAENLTSDAICKRLDQSLIEQAKVNQGFLKSLINLHHFAIEGYCGKHICGHEDLAAALLYTCRALAFYDLLDDKETAKKLGLLIKKGVIYKKLGLIRSQVTSLEDAIAFGKKDHVTYLNPSLHYTLAIAYKNLNRLEDTKEQLYIVLNTKKRYQKPSSLHTKAQELLNTIENGDEPKGKESTDQDADVLKEFLEKNIQDECLQILYAHYQANSEVHSYRKVLIWEEFVQRIANAKTVKTFCEAIFSSIEKTEKVTSLNLYRLARLTNIAYCDVAMLTQIKTYTQDALKVYREQERRKVDQALDRVQLTQEGLKREIEFENFKNHLKEKLCEGERIRPNSPIRAKIAELAANLVAIKMDQVEVVKALSAIMDEKISAHLHIVVEDLIPILEFALETDIKPFDFQKHVLIVKGTNVFLSQVIDKVKEAIKHHQMDVYTVEFIGVNVYIDVSFTLHGINCAFGGDIEFLKNGDQKPLIIDLSGEAGVRGEEVKGDNKDGKNFFVMKVAKGMMEGMAKGENGEEIFAFTTKNGWLDLTLTL